VFGNRESRLLVLIMFSAATRLVYKPGVVPAYLVTGG